MARAIEAQPFSVDFKRYLNAQLAIPAGNILRRVEAANGGAG